MWRLIRKILAIGATALVGLLYLAFGPGKYEHPLSALVNKVELLKGAPSRKLVVLGGSGVLRGIETSRLSSQFNVEAVNLSLFVGFGLDVYLEVIEHYINPGDLVLLSPEYGGFESGMLLNDAEAGAWAWRISYPYLPKLELGSVPLSYWPSRVPLLASSKIKAFFLALFSPELTDKTSGLWDYSRKFDRYGDLIVDFGYADELTGSSYRLSLNQLDRSIEVIEKLEAIVSKAGGMLRIIPAAVPDFWYEANRPAVESLWRQVEQSVPALGKPADFVFPKPMFADTVYHLRDSGRFFRTEKLIDLLQAEGVLGVRRGTRFVPSGLIEPQKYDLISGFHQDRIFTQGDAYIHGIEFRLDKASSYSLLLRSHGWSALHKDPQALGLRVYADGDELKFDSREGFEYRFNIPEGKRSIDEVRIVSNTFRPIDVGMSGDGRILGIDVENISIQKNP